MTTKTKLFNVDDLYLEYRLLRSGKIIPDTGTREARIQQIELDLFPDDKEKIKLPKIK
ncbi:hypothetical protein Aam_104_001 [Acidocella aminolytica 101 = DSM 11237]|uniref:Uncharacterized protein n=1 Tax=Acidocella aminolytica 101 = DSM 11237 TaxID=1120923 RepID=A0A0D6PK43_9PROT|nr:hypothetical protein Aam_104_001 [Acidocella aminolytica 101 = DSM 11237]GBQ42021.1 hypothetical protein AA11237_2842 [Acidocella aminolytica 101 = DSM 11237]